MMFTGLHATKVINQPLCILNSNAWNYLIIKSAFYIAWLNIAAALGLSMGLANATPSRKGWSQKRLSNCYLHNLLLHVEYVPCIQTLTVWQAWLTSAVADAVGVACSITADAVVARSVLTAHSEIERFRVSATSLKFACVTHVMLM